MVIKPFYNINKTFLINLLNDLNFVVNSPNIILYLISNLYDIFETSISKAVKHAKKINESQGETKPSIDESIESPINFFHYIN